MKQVRRWSIRSKLIFNVTLVHLALMSLFVSDTVTGQKEFLWQEARQSALNFTELMAENVSSWVLAEDLMGMDEVLQAGAATVGARYACVVGPEGQVLAHTDKARVGQWLNDDEARRLLRHGGAGAHTWREDAAQIHAAAPIDVDGETLGWALVGVDTAAMSGHLRKLHIRGVFYTLAAMLCGAFAAWLLARSMFRQVAYIMDGIKRLRRDELSESIPIFSQDELGHIGMALNRAMEYLRRSRGELKKALHDSARAEKQLRYLNRRLVDGNEEDRKRLGHDLHDEFGQSVMGLLFGLHSLKNFLGDRPEALALCEQMISEAQRFGDDIRRVAAYQYPVVLDRLGLGVEAQSFLTECASRHPHLELRYDIALPAGRLAPRIEVACYRILQEGIANILRHSGATRASVLLSTLGEWVYLRMEDDGRGFAADDRMDESLEFSGIGLLGMQARVASVDGYLEVESRPGAGCVIDVFLPLAFRTGGRGGPGEDGHE